MKYKHRHSVVKGAFPWLIVVAFVLLHHHSYLWIPATAWQCSPGVSQWPRLQQTPTAVTAASTTALLASSSSSSEPSDDQNSSNQQIQKHLEERNNALQIEKTRQQLEHANTRSFLKRKPRKLPYEDARRWVQANLGCDTEEEYDDLVANGNLRTPYIPKRPQEYYTGTREWISWEHYLKGCFDQQNPSAVKPRTGVFD